jgi:DNA-binding HxlR family transcriptional regulator
LEDEGLVERQVEPGSPVRVTYSLTASGAALGPAIRELKAWAKVWKRAG